MPDGEALRFREAESGSMKWGTRVRRGLCEEGKECYGESFGAAVRRKNNIRGMFHRTQILKYPSVMQTKADCDISARSEYGKTGGNCDEI